MPDRTPCRTSPRGSSDGVSERQKKTSAPAKPPKQRRRRNSHRSFPRIGLEHFPHYPASCGIEHMFDTLESWPWRRSPGTFFPVKLIEQLHLSWRSGHRRLPVAEAVGCVGARRRAPARTATVIAAGDPSHGVDDGRLTLAAAAPFHGVSGRPSSIPAARSDRAAKRPASVGAVRRWCGRCRPTGRRRSSRRSSTVPRSS